MARKIQLYASGTIAMLYDGGFYADGIGYFMLDSGGIRLSLPSNIRYLVYAEDDGRVIANTEDGNQIELTDFNKTILTAALDAGPAASAAKAVRLLQPVAPPPAVMQADPTPAELSEAARLQTIDTTISTATFGAVQPATRVQLKAFSNAEFNTWFDLNVTNAATAIALLKLLTRIIVRRLL